MREHFSSMLSLEYLPHDPDALAAGDSATLCKGIGALPWPLRIPDTLDRLRSLTSQLVGTIKLLRLHVAPLEGDVHLFNRAEGMIGRHFKDHLQVTTFFGTGVRLPVAIPGGQRLRLRLSLAAGASVVGFPTEIV